MDGLLAYFRLTDDPGRLAEAAPALTLVQDAGKDVARPAVEAGSLAGGGWMDLGNVLAAREARALAGAVTGLRARGLPGTLAYAFAEPWALGARVRATIEASLGVAYALVDDAWAFSIAPGTAGWPPHRGIASPVLDRARPEVLNAWVAITDAPVDRACMHVVPLDEDPAYPSDLGLVAPPPGAAKPLPALAGHALAWNANLLHWGGASVATSPGPRISLSFTVVRADAAERLGLAERTVDPWALGIADRVRLVARQLRTYGEGQDDVSADALAWARALGHLDPPRRKEG